MKISDLVCDLVHSRHILIMNIFYKLGSKFSY